MKPNECSHAEAFECVELLCFVPKGHQVKGVMPFEGSQYKNRGQKAFAIISFVASTSCSVCSSLLDVLSCETSREPHQQIMTQTEMLGNTDLPKDSRRVAHQDRCVW